MGKSIEVEVTPEFSMQINVHADHLVDLQVAITEEQLVLREEQLIADLKGLHQRHEDLTAKRANVFDKISKKHAKIVSTILSPALKKAGVKKINTRVEIVESRSARSGRSAPRLDVQVQISPGDTCSNAHGSITISRLVPIPKELKTTYTAMKEIDQKVRLIDQELAKIKVDLMNIDRIERKARGVLAQKALESTSQGRNLLNDLRRKALPAPK